MTLLRRRRQPAPEPDVPLPTLAEIAASEAGREARGEGHLVPPAWLEAHMPPSMPRPPPLPPPAKAAPPVIASISSELTGEALAAFRRDLTAALLPPGVLGYVVAAVEPSGHASLTHASLMDRPEAERELRHWRGRDEWGRHVVCAVTEVT